MENPLNKVKKVANVLPFKKGEQKGLAKLESGSSAIANYLTENNVQDKAVLSKVTDALSVLSSVSESEKVANSALQVANLMTDTPSEPKQPVIVEEPAVSNSTTSQTNTAAQVGERIRNV